MEYLFHVDGSLFFSWRWQLAGRQIYKNTFNTVCFPICKCCAMTVLVSNALENETQWCRPKCGIAVDFCCWLLGSNLVPVADYPERCFIVLYPCVRLLPFSSTHFPIRFQCPDYSTLMFWITAPLNKSAFKWMLYGRPAQPVARRQNFARWDGDVWNEKVHSNPVITTSVYTTPHLYSQMFCGTN